MGPEVTIDVLRQMLYVVVCGVAVLILPALGIGLLVAVVQAATQINEMTLSFLPKLVVILTMVAIMGPWLLHLLVNFTQKLVTEIPYLIG